jgi:hypothetical protein
MFRCRPLALALSLLSLLAAPAVAHADRAWRDVAPLPQARTDHAAAGLGGRVYVAGGERLAADGWTTLRGFAAYDPAADEWTPRALLPAPRHDLALVRVGRFLYAIGGIDAEGIAHADVWRWNRAADRWRAMPSLPQPLGGVAAAAVDGRIYVFGTQTYAWTPGEPAWATLPGPPNGQPNIDAAAATVAAEGLIYLFGEGVVYDPATGEFRPLAPVPNRNPDRFGAYCGECGGSAARGPDGRLYLAGGMIFGAVAQPSDDVWVYTPASDTWALAARTGGGTAYGTAVTSGDRLYALGGLDPNFEPIRGAAAAPFGDEEPPAMTRAPQPRIGAAFSDELRRVPVDLTFRGADAQTDVRAYHVQRRRGDEAFADVFAPWQFGIGEHFDATPGIPYTFRAQPADELGNVGVFAAGPSFRGTITEENVGAIAYSAGWTRAALAGSLGGSVMRTDTAGATATFPWSGRSVALVVPRLPTGGTATVAVDGDVLEMIDLAGGFVEPRIIVSVAEALPAGEHTLRVRARTGRIAIDGFLVLDY